MPKSKHRKNQKQKANARTQRIKTEQNFVQKKFKEYFTQEMDKLKDRDLEISEVEKTDEESSVLFFRVKIDISTNTNI